jgi:2',3'-cyclic-nucleotide 2'-phosphodiesterase (5'-nucleotidase family)
MLTKTFQTAFQLAATLYCVFSLSFASIAQEEDADVVPLPEKRVRLLYFSSYPEIIQNDTKPGLAELTSAIREQSAGFPNSFFIDGGASLGPSVLGSMDGGAHMIDLLNSVAPALMALGKKELSYGYDSFIVNSLAATFPIITTNLVNAKSGMPIENTEQSYLMESPPLNIGFAALTSANAIIEYGATQVRDINTELAIANAASDLLSQGADAIILLADTDYDDLSALRKAGSVDVIFYTHNFGNPYTLDHQGILLKEGPLDNKLLVLDLWLDATGSRRTLKTKAHTVDISTYEPAPDIAMLVSSYQTRLKQLLSKQLATVSAPFDTLQDSMRSQENAFGNLVADALLHVTNADAAIINSGSIRGNATYNEGYRISRGDIQKELPFENSSALIELDGYTLLKAIEHSIDCGLRRDGCFLQVSNITVTYSSDRPLGSRTEEVLINGEKLALDRQYTIAMPDFIARGSDGFSMFSNTKKISIPGTKRLIWDMVSQHLEENPQFTPSTHGRIKDIASYLQEADY